jgi:hypothetical protein
MYIYSCVYVICIYKIRLENIERWVPVAQAYNLATQEDLV